MPWPGGEHEFALPMAKMEALQNTCGAAPGVVYRRLLSLECDPRDVRHVLRLGLTGGGMSGVEANALVDRILGERGLGVLSPYALTVLTHFLYYGSDDPPEKRAAESPPSDGGSPRSTEQEP